MTSTGSAASSHRPAASTPAASTPAASTPAVVACALLGLAGTVGLVLVGVNLGAGRPASALWFWHRPPWDAARIGVDHAEARFLASLVLLADAWLALGYLVLKAGLGWRPVAAIAALWSIPLLVGPPLLSDDVFSYVAQGELLVKGHDPYVVGPSALGDIPIARSSSPFWFNSPSPYGPVFLRTAQLIAWASHGNPFVAVLLFRLLAVVALAATVWFAAQLARRAGRPVATVVWLLAASPLVLLQALSGVHNDIYVGLTAVAAVHFASRRRWCLGLAVGTVGLLVKLPTAAVVGIIAVAWLAERGDARERLVRLGKAVGVTAGVSAAVVLAAGLGTGFLSSFSDNGSRVYDFLSPIDALEHFTQHLGRLQDLARDLDPMHTVVGGYSRVGLLLVGLVGVALARRHDLGRVAGTALALMALVNVIFWPWYLLWALPLLIATGTARTRAVAILLSVLTLPLLLPGGATLVAADYGNISVVFGITLVVTAVAAVGLLLGAAPRGTSATSSAR